MAQITLQGSLANTQGELPRLGEVAPNFVAFAIDLSEKSLSDYRGSRVVLNVFPSVDTSVCAASVRKFNQEVASLPNTKVVCISKDLPFAQSRFCVAENIANVDVLSDFRGDFEQKYPVVFADSSYKGLLSRAIIVLDEFQRVIYTEQVSETANEPNYQAIFNLLR